MTLYQAPVGESIIIVSLLNNEYMLKLVEIGFLDDKMLEIKAKSIGGEPICVLLNNSKIMLRREEAESIIVRQCNHNFG